MKNFFLSHKKIIIAVIAGVCIFAILIPLFIWGIENDISDETATYSDIKIFSGNETDLLEQSIISSEWTADALKVCVDKGSPLSALNKDDVFVITEGSSDVFGEVYFGEIKSKNKKDDNYFIEIVTPAADEVFDSIDMDCNVDMSLENIATISAVDGVVLEQLDELNAVSQCKTNGAFLPMNNSEMIDFDVKGDDIVFDLNVDILDLLKKQGVGSETEIHAERITTADKANNTNVYYTDTGLCYHRETCQCLSKSKYLTSLKDAVFEKELCACRICEAPVLVYDDYAEKISASASLKLEGQVVLKDLSFGIVGREGDDWSVKNGFSDLSVKTGGVLEAEATLTGNFNGSLSGTSSRLTIWGDKNNPKLYLEGLNEKLLPLVFITWNGGTVSVKVGPACDEVHAPLTVGLMLYTDIYGKITASTEVYCSYTKKLSCQYDVFRNGEFVEAEDALKIEDSSDVNWYIKAEAEADVDVRTLNVSTMVYIGNMNILEFCLTRFGIDGKGNIVLNASNISAFNSLAANAELCVYAEYFDLDFKMKLKHRDKEEGFDFNPEPIIRLELAKYEYSYENSVDIVVDAINYEKDVIPVYIEGYGGYTDAYGKHKVRLPELTISSPMAEAFNNKIYTEFYEYYDILINNREEHRIYDIDYDYKVYDDFLSIVVEEGGGVQAGGGWQTNHVYYFDLFKNEEITFDEYLERMGLDKKTLTEKIMNHDEYSQIEFLPNPDNGINITDVMIEKDNVIIYYDAVGYFDWGCATFKMNIFEE